MPKSINTMCKPLTNKSSSSNLQTSMLEIIIILGLIDELVDISLFISDFSIDFYNEFIINSEIISF